MSQTPELDKQAALIASGEPAIVQGFIDWLFDETLVVLAEYDEHERLQPTMERREVLMARYFDIDLDKIEQERRTLLSQIQNSNLGRET